MGSFRCFCDDTSMHGWQYLGRGERRPIWLLVIVASIALSAYFLFKNLDDYQNSATITSLNSSTESLDSVLFPSVTVCSPNQMRTTFLKAVSLYNNKTLTKLVTKYYFDGHDNMSDDDIKLAKGLVSSEPFQQVFCDWMVHTEQYLEMGMPKPLMVNGKCDFKDDPAEFVNYVSITNTKGWFILKAEFNDHYNYHLRPAVGTDMGICATINPIIDFNPHANLSTKIIVGENSTSGDTNGLTLVIDTEAYDHGFEGQKGSGAAVVVHHHGDQPLLSTGKIKLSAGTDTDISVVPSVTTTTEDAISSFLPDQRYCFNCDEVNLLFFPYYSNTPGFCQTHQGFRYSMANCMLESAIEEILDKCGCYPAFHGKYFQSPKRNNETLLKSMPFIKLDNLTSYATCKGKGLFCSKKILNKISNYKKIWDPVLGQSVSCLQSCTDQTNTVATTQADFPAQPTFPSSSEFCMLMIKFVDACKDRTKTSSLNDAYPGICNSTGKIKDSIKTVMEGLPGSLPTAFLGGSGSPVLEKNEDRDKVLQSFCQDDQVWKPAVLNSSLSKDEVTAFQTAMYTYAVQNLLRVNVYLKEPFVTSYVRDTETTFISFVSTVGGLMGLCMGFSVVSAFEIVYYLVLVIGKIITGKTELK